MTDFETHPVGTADLVKRLRNAAGVDPMEYQYPMLEAADRIEQLEASLTRANAATAAAYEVAAQVINDRGAVEQENFGLDRATQNFFRALATPDQTAALDKLIAEAKADALSGPWEDKPDAMTATVEASYPHITKDYDTYTQALELVSSRHSKGALVALVNHLLAASKKGGV